MVNELPEKRSPIGRSPTMVEKEDKDFCDLKEKIFKKYDTRDKIISEASIEESCLLGRISSHPLIPL